MADDRETRKSDWKESVKLILKIIVYGTMIAISLTKEDCDVINRLSIILKIVNETF